MDRQERHEWLRLMWTKGMSFEWAKRLLTEVGLPETIFDSKYTDLEKVVPPSLAKRIVQKTDWENEDRIQAALRWLEETENADLVTLIDPRYPSLLLTVPQPPLAFFVWGDDSFLQLPSVALVGSQHPNAEGEALSREWAVSLAQSPIVLVGGLKEGIQREALRSAWKWHDAKMILVCDSGMALYPQKSAVMAFSQRHLVVSLSGPYDQTESEVADENVNRLLLGLCSSFVLVQASLRSSSLLLLREALDLNRNVMAIPGSIHSPLSKGGHRMIKDGARLVETTDEVLHEMGIGLLSA